MAGVRHIDSAMTKAGDATKAATPAGRKNYNKEGRLKKPYYEKELEVRMSRSYGPGRYDPIYEKAGIDYPAGYVRWTEARNLEAFLQLSDDAIER